MLKNGAILAYDNLKKKLEPHGYTTIVGTTGMWEHKMKQTKFCFCVDDFGIKYHTHEDVMHLLNAIEHDYDYTVD